MRSSDGYATGYNPSGQRSPVPYMQQSGDAVDACATPLQSISSALCVALLVHLLAS